MSILAVHSFDNTTATNDTDLMSIGSSHFYYFYQQLSTATKESLQQKPKQIIPPIPRKRVKTSKNSPLSPIRSQKIMQNKAPTTTAIKLFMSSKRPYPLVSTFSSPASMETVKRQPKVSFDEKVVVICTVFDEDDDNELPEGCEKLQTRRHSTGEPCYPKSILIYKQALPVSPPITQKITQSLKHFKNRLLFT